MHMCGKQTFAGPAELRGRKKKFSQAGFAGLPPRAHTYTQSLVHTVVTYSGGSLPGTGPPPAFF